MLMVGAAVKPEGPGLPAKMCSMCAFITFSSLCISDTYSTQASSDASLYPSKWVISNHGCFLGNFFNNPLLRTGY